jgi:hypothetical protein
MGNRNHATPLPDSSQGHSPDAGIATAFSLAERNPNAIIINNRDSPPVAGDHLRAEVGMRQETG